MSRHLQTLWALYEIAVESPDCDEWFVRSLSREYFRVYAGGAR